MDKLPHAPATKRNRGPILERLEQLLPTTGTVLEIGSGTGEHAEYFCRHLAGIRWQPSDCWQNLSGLEARFEAADNPRILPVLRLDVLGDEWPHQTYSAAFSANTAHIMHWNAVQAMFAGIGSHLQPNGRFCLYGPFKVDNCYTSQSNASFDAGLRYDDPQMGLRDMEALDMLARDCNMKPEYRIPMPANNFLLIFHR